MKSTYKTIITGVAAVAAIATCGAQNRTGYFLEDYTYRYQLNPAYGNSRGFVSMPAIGNVNVETSGTLKVSDVIYNVDGRTTTFLNPGVPVQEVLDNIGDNKRFGTDLKVQPLAFGFKGLGGYNTVSVSVNARESMELPGDVFRLLKEGVSNQSYNIGSIKGHAVAYGEVALNHSHQINSQLRIGATLKFLVGAGDFNVDMRKAELDLNEDAWVITADGDVHARIKNLEYTKKRNETTGMMYIDDVNLDKFDINGMGMGLDLGAVYTPAFLDGLEISAAVLDLGFIKWDTDMLASTDGVRTFSTAKYTFNVEDDAPNSFKNEFDRIGDDLEALYQLRDMGDQGSSTTSLATTVNVGAKYNLPIYKPMSFGLLNTTRIDGDHGWTEFRLSANWAPAKVFDCAASFGAGTFGPSFGWIANLHVTGFNLFMGMDKTPAKFTKDMVPMSSNASVNFGINFLF